MLSSRFRGRSIALSILTLSLTVAALLIVVQFIGRGQVESARIPVVKQSDIVAVSADQLHQIEIVKVLSQPFAIKKSAIGQIAFNEDASTVVFSPFYGRVTRIFAKIGDVIKRGQPLFEIDSPEVVQAQTDLIAALHNRDKAKSQLTIAQRQAERQSRLFKTQATSGREMDQAMNDQTAAE